MTDFVCDVHIDSRSACKGLEFYGEHEGKQYCVLHFPGENKKDDFKKVLETKLAREDYNFSRTVFPEDTSFFGGFEFNAQATFFGATFQGDTNFVGTQFSGGATFSEAHFSGEWTLFTRAHFSDGTGFKGAHFRGTRIDFSDAQFSGERTEFSGAQFDSAETVFHETTFVKEVYFSGATFRERVAFWGSKANPVFGSGAWARFNRSRLEKPELLTFNTVLLHPGWFCNTDVRKVDFTDVKWYGMPGGPEGTLDEEIGALTNRNIESPNTLLSQACQRLAANAEENRDYRLANDFYYWSMDALRKAGWRRLGLIRTLYWALSGYGVRAARAFLVLAGICAVFAVLYMLLGPNALRVSPASSFGQALEHGGQAVVYSLSTMARLNPEPKPDPGLFQFLVAIEGILGPLQIALLALAIRRKVMR